MSETLINTSSPSSEIYSNIIVYNSLSYYWQYSDIYVNDFSSKVNHNNFDYLLQFVGSNYKI